MNKRKIIAAGGFIASGVLLGLSLSFPPLAPILGSLAGIFSIGSCYNIIKAGRRVRVVPVVVLPAVPNVEFYVLMRNPLQEPLQRTLNYTVVNLDPIIFSSHSKPAKGATINHYEVKETLKCQKP